jgi:hypothetical protein
MLSAEDNDGMEDGGHPQTPAEDAMNEPLWQS